VAHADDAYVQEILRLEPLLRVYLHRLAPKHADMEDLLQETYTRLLDLPSERRVAIHQLQAFVITTARNVALDWIRRRRITPIDAIEDLDQLPSALTAGSSSVEDVVNAHQQLLHVAAAVADLPTRCAEVFTLRKVYGWSQKEIAEHFGISVSTVEAHLVKAARRCSEKLSASASQGTTGTVARPNWLRRLARGRGG
jgi:RNA polymerase sigma-70 factor (ECF subfamily)